MKVLLDECLPKKLKREVEADKVAKLLTSFWYAQGVRQLSPGYHPGKRNRQDPTLKGFKQALQ